MAERNAPIGIFDSGVGGLTVARAIVDQLPDESIIYIGDTANGPYGPQPISRVREHATRIADELVARGCKMLVIACNTASAAFLRDARERYDIPVVEVILPAVRRAVPRLMPKKRRKRKTAHAPSALAPTRTPIQISASKAAWITLASIP